MKNKQTKILLIVTAVLALLYFFKDSIFGSKEDPENDGADIIDSDSLPTDTEMENPPVHASDWDELVGYNSTKTDIVKSVQKLLNAAIYNTRGWKHSNAKIEVRRKKIAALPGLTTDGKFGPKTLAAAKLISGHSMVSKHMVYTNAKNWRIQKESQTGKTKSSQSSEWREEDTSGFASDQI